MIVKTIKPFEHYPVGTELDISSWLYREKPEYFEKVEDVVKNVAKTVKNQKVKNKRT